MTEVLILSNFEKNMAAQKAREDIRELIYYGGFSEKNAHILAARYLAYAAEGFLHIEDMECEEGNASDEWTANVRTKRLEIEGGLFRAQEDGDYTLVKREMLWFADTYGGRFASQIEKLTLVMKDQDERFLPPLPAWVPGQEGV